MTMLDLIEDHLTGVGDRTAAELLHGVRWARGREEQPPPWLAEVVYELRAERREDREEREADGLHKGPEGRNDRFQIALRHDDLGLDDVVVREVNTFRMERMDDDYVWLACYLIDGQEIVFDLWRDKKIIKYKAREPLPNVVYEERP